MEANYIQLKASFIQYCRMDKLEKEKIFAIFAYD